MQMWNPWHGCHKKSEGCENCYMFSFDKARNIDSNKFFLTKNFDMPLKKDKKGNFKIQDGSNVMLCLTSDFFLEEADDYRNQVWQIIKERENVNFEVITKRIERVKENLPKNFLDDFKNFKINVTIENQKRAEERLPIFINLDLNYRGVIVAPMLEKINIEKFLQTGKINKVSVAGENYKNARPIHFEWVQDVARQCKKYNVEFEFYDTGNNFYFKEKHYFIPHRLGKQQAQKASLFL